jgi:RNA polymerase sigma factor (sigma-70 family)
MDIQKEQEIIERARINPEAFAEIFEAYYGAIFRYAAYRTGNAETAADITSETFFKALNKLGTFRFRGVPFSAWLYRIAGNEANLFFRRRKYEPVSFNSFDNENAVPHEPVSSADIESELAAAQEEIDGNKAYQQAKTALRTLPEKYQEVIILRYMQDKKISEIGLITGMNEGTVKSLISRGLKKIKKIMA